MLVTEETHDLLGAAEAVKLREDEVDGFLDAKVGREDDRVIFKAIKADGQAEVELAAFGFVHLGGAQLRTHGIPLGFGKGTFQAEEEAIIV